MAVAIPLDEFMAIVGMVFVGFRKELGWALAKQHGTYVPCGQQLREPKSRGQASA
jgi:hypothetical protein